MQPLKQSSYWYIYMIECDNASLYTGITTDMTRRWNQHSSQSGAKYFRGRTPKYLVYLELAENRSLASKKEAKIKRLNKQKKLELIQSAQNKINSIALTGWEFID